MRPIAIQFQVEPAATGLPQPDYRRQGDPAMTLCAAEDVFLEPMVPLRVFTGVSFGIPDGLAAHILPEPSQAEFGLVPVPDILGPEDRQPLSILMIWLSPGLYDPFRPYPVKRGEPIARIAFFPAVRVALAQVRRLAVAPSAPLPSAD